jgi:galactose-1-phosphate uridylyltransferase
MARKENNTRRHKKVSDGEWGIHFSNKSLPEERFDPFCTYLDKDGKKIGHRTIFNPIRLQRPFEFTPVKHKNELEKDTSYSDTFCKIVEGKLPAIVITEDKVLVNNPLSIKPRTENMRSSIVFSAINLYPPISRILKSPELNKKNSKHIPEGLSLIHVFTKHYKFPEEIPSNEWLMFFQNYRLTIKESINNPAIISTDNLQISTFFNIGSKAGASIAHLHGQTVLRFNQEGIGARQNSYMISSKQKEKNCQKCQLWVDHDDSATLPSISLKKRILFKNPHWIAFLAYAPKRDAQIRIIPNRHISNIWSMNDDELLSLASILIKSNERLAAFIMKDGERYQLSLDRNIILNQHHSAKEKHFHMFIDILPVQQTGGAEIFDDQKFSMIYPEDVVRMMISEH